MDQTRIANELVRIAKSLVSADRELESIAKVVETIVEGGGGLFDIKRPISKLPFVKDVSYSGSRVCIVNLKNRKTVLIAHKNNADKGSNDIMVMDYVIGYNQ
jgi:hypothetical protein